MTPPTKTKRGKAPLIVPAGEAPRQRADARRNREAVLEAARAKFAKQGLECGMDEIAKAAKVGVGTVYRHFPNKEALVQALVEDRFQRLADRAADALADDDPWQAFCNLIRWSAELQARDRGLSELLASRPQLGQQAAWESGLVGSTQILMKKAQRAGKMRRDAVVEDVPTMLCGLGGVIGAEDLSMSALNWERFIGIMLDGLRAPGHEKLPPPEGDLGPDR
jgi:AcrR family transcriptional regulator